VITFLTTSLNNHPPTVHTPTNTNLLVTQESNDESAEVLSDVSDNPPTHPPPVPRLMVTGTNTSDCYYYYFIQRKEYTKGLKPVKGGPPGKKRHIHTHAAQKALQRQLLATRRYKKKRL